MSTDHALPLDIPYDTLPEWLAQRSITSTKWLRDLKKLRVKIVTVSPIFLEYVNSNKHPQLQKILDRCSLPSMSDPSGHSTFADHCCYVDAKEILNVLRTATDIDQTKSLFGYYKNDLLSKWDDIVRCYESSSLYLAEGARSMVQDCKYEVGAMKKKSDANASRMVEIERRLKDLHRIQKECEKDYAIELNRLNINDESDQTMLNNIDTIRQRLENRVGELIAKFAAIHTCIQSDDMNHIIQYYQLFQNKLMHNVNRPTIGCCSAIRKLLVADVIDKVTDAEGEEEEEEVDWAAMLEAGTDEDGTNSGSGSGSGSGEVEKEEIDWSAMLEVGVEEEEKEKEKEKEKNPAAAEIVWDIGTVDDSDHTVVSNETKETPLSTANERSNVLSNLEELTCFLKQRIFETNEDENLGQNMLRTIDSVKEEEKADDDQRGETKDDTKDVKKINLQLTSFSFSYKEQLHEWLKYLNNVITMLTKDPSLATLIIISKGGKGLNTMLYTFERLKRKSEKCQKGITNMESEKKKLSEENKRFQPIITFYRQKIQKIKRNVETGLHKLYPQQTFVLVGELNTI